MVRENEAEVQSTRQDCDQLLQQLRQAKQEKGQLEATKVELQARLNAAQDQNVRPLLRLREGTGREGGGLPPFHASLPPPPPGAAEPGPLLLVPCCTPQPNSPNPEAELQPSPESHRQGHSTTIARGVARATVRALAGAKSRARTPHKICTPL